MPVQSGIMSEVLAPTDGVRFRVVGGRNVVFSEVNQKLLELNDIAAFIWRSFEDRFQLETILAEMTEQGIDRATAENYVRVAVMDWINQGFIRPASLRASDFPTDGAHLVQDVEVADVAMRIRYAASRTHYVASIFRHLEVAGIEPSVVLEVASQGDRDHLFRNGSWIQSCCAQELATVLKGQVMNEVLERGSYEVALHAASLMRNGRMLLISGHPGAGKTTLTLALMHAGFGLAGDDLALLGRTGQVTGVPFAPAVKAGAWKLVAAYWPDIKTAPVFRRPDRKRVRYIVPTALTPPAQCPVGWLVLLHRRPGKGASLTPVDPIDAVRELLDGAFAQDDRLTAAGFEAVASVIDGAECHHLTYSRLEDATELLIRVCQ